MGGLEDTAPSEAVEKSTEPPAVLRGENRWDRQRFALAKEFPLFKSLTALGKTKSVPGFRISDDSRIRLTDFFTASHGRGSVPARGSVSCRERFSARRL